ncbi:MAG: hypothetical protein LKG17_07110 [Megasphaera sp.]|nr:hypothetical protein [Megasphaera sp.]
MKEVPIFKVGNYYGYNQELFTDHWMNIGGCGAVTACDVSIFLALNHGLTKLYSFDVRHIRATEYIRFSQLMKPYLRPRQSGIDTLELWIDGYSRYVQDCGETNVYMRGLSAACSLAEMEKAVRRAIDNNLPVPYLNLRHANPNMISYVWHWFWLAGYEGGYDDFLVKVVTYGSYRWLPLKELWDTGYEKKGGLILLSLPWDR